MMTVEGDEREGGGGKKERESRREREKELGGEGEKEKEVAMTKKNNDGSMRTVPGLNNNAPKPKD